MKMQKILSGIVLSTLLMTQYIPLTLADEEKSDTYYLYLDQAQLFKGNDLGAMMDSIRKVLFQVGTHENCQNFTKDSGLNFETVEEFTDAFTSLMTSIDAKCWSVVTSNAKIYSTPFYGYGKILEWYRDLNYAIKSHPEIDLSKKTDENIDAAQVEKKETESKVEQIDEKVETEVVKNDVNEEKIVKTEAQTTPAEVAKEAPVIEVSDYETPVMNNTETTLTNEVTESEKTNNTDINETALSEELTLEIKEPTQETLKSEAEIFLPVSTPIPTNDENSDGLIDVVNERYDLPDLTSSIDANYNNIPDELDERIIELTGIGIANGWQDTDNDGISDSLEVLSGLEINDSTSSGRNDAEYLLDGNFRSGEPTIVNYSTSIGNSTHDATPLIKGTLRKNEIATFYYFDANNQKIVVGVFKGEEQNKFIGEFSALADGTYIIYGETTNDKGKLIKRFTPVTITIDTQLAHESKIKIDGLVKAEVSKKYAKRPVLKGYAKPKSRVEGYWQSLILSSAVIADADTGYFEISPSQDLEEGDHKVWIYSTDSETGVKSENEKVEFNLNSTVETTVLNLKNTTSETSKIYLLAGISLLIIGGFTVIYRFARKS